MECLVNNITEIIDINNIVLDYKISRLYTLYDLNMT
jgi:hypothetical protein